MQTWMIIKVTPGYQSYPGGRYMYFFFHQLVFHRQVLFLSILYTNPNCSDGGLELSREAAPGQGVQHIITGEHPGHFHITRVHHQLQMTRKGHWVLRGKLFISLGCNPAIKTQKYTEVQVFALGYHWCAAMYSILVLNVSVMESGHCRVLIQYVDHIPPRCPCLLNFRIGPQIGPKVNLIKSFNNSLF